MATQEKGRRVVIISTLKLKGSQRRMSGMAMKLRSLWNSPQPKSMRIRVKSGFPYARQVRTRRTLQLSLFRTQLVTSFLYFLFSGVTRRPIGLVPTQRKIILPSVNVFKKSLTARVLSENFEDIFSFG